MVANRRSSIAKPLDRAEFRRRLRLAVLLPAALTAGLAMVLLWQVLHLIEEVRAIEDSDQVMAQIPDLHRRWIEMELALGRYFQVRSPELLDEHIRLRAEIDADLAELERQVADRPAVFSEVHELLTLQAEYSVLADADIARGGEPVPPQGVPGQGEPPPPIRRVDYVPQMARSVAELTLAEQTVRQHRRDAAITSARRLVSGAIGATLVLGVWLTLFGRRQLLKVSDDYEHALEFARSQEAELRRLATHDALTGLPNRRLFRERLDRALAAAGESGAKTAVLYVDLDGFKEINDRLGHAAGDQLLVGVSQRLTMSVRPGDTIARMGGDEFTVLATGLADDDEAEAIAKAIRASLATPFVLEGETVAVTASIGVALATGATPDADALMRRSDGALYRAKADGKSRYVVGAD